MPTAFTPGNLVIYRVGNGSSSLANTGSPVFLDEYTSAGAFVQSIALPTADSGQNNSLVASGTATSEGLLTRTSDGQYLVLTGYDSTIPNALSLSGTTASSVNRVIGRVDANGNIDTSTALTDAATSSSIRSVVSTNGTDFWVVGGAGGIRYTTLGSTTSTQLSTTLTNLRQVQIFEDQLYVSTASGASVRVGTVGTGLPTTSGQTITNLPGFSTTGSPYGFLLVDLTSSVAGVDTLYVADDGASQIQKFSLVSGSWVNNGSVTASAVRGLTGSASGSTVSLFATTGGSNGSGGGSLYGFTDSTGYNVSISGSVTTLATAAANTAFRGIAFAPVVATPPTVSIVATDATASEGNSDKGSFTISRGAGNTTGDLTVTFSVGGGTASSGDYSLSVGGTPVAGPSFAVTIPNGASSVVIDLQAIAESFDIAELAETFILTLSSDAAYAIDSANASAIVTIAANGTVVTNTSDSGEGSLRQAVLNANAIAGTQTITFAIPGSGPHSINLASALPTLTETVIIDGWSQGGANYSASPLIELNGAGAGSDANGLVLGGGSQGSEIRGLVINRFASSGILLQSANNTIRGNYIGTDTTGTVDQGNGANGIEISATGNIIGGSAASDRNIISGNDESGLLISGSGNQVRGNYIGTDVTGTANLGNTLDGIQIQSVNNIIGGSAAGQGNTIAFNLGNGVSLVDAANSAIQGNSIFANNGLGIDLNDDGLTLNDTDDVDTGANGLQNFPVLTNVASNAAGSTVSGFLNSAASTQFRIEFFANANYDATGAGAGEIFLGAQTITTDASGNSLLSFDYSPINGKPYLSATATNLTTGDTSEFSHRNQAPVNKLFSNLTLNEDTATVFSAVNSNAITISDEDSSSKPVQVALTATNGTIELAGTSLLITAGADGSSSITLQGTVSEINAALEGLTFTPTANFSGSASLAVITNDLAPNELGGSLQDTDTIDITVTADADVPTLTVTDAVGNEDEAIALGISAALIDTDGSETLLIEISGVPTGATLSAGTDQGGGVWQLTAAQLNSLTLTPPTHSDADFSLSVKAVSTDGSDTAQITASLAVTVNSKADAPTLSVTDASGDEDTAIALTISGALTDTDGSETLAFEISGVPIGATLSAGSDQGSGVWILAEAQLSGLTITPPANSDADFTLSVKAISTDGSDTAQTTKSLTVTVNPKADAPALSATDALGDEDTAIALDISATLSDTDGSETLSFEISGVPVGASLSAGVDQGNGVWKLTETELNGLTIIPPANSDADFTLSTKAISSDGSDTAQTTKSLVVTVNPKADAPTLSVTNALGNEDTAIALTISGALTDTDGSEALAFEISGVPTGATLSAGSNQGSGIWRLTEAQLSGLTITPPANSDTDFTLSVKAISTDGSDTAHITKSLVVTVNPKADIPTLTVMDAVGNEDEAIALSIFGALTDTDGSEKLAFEISGVPTGATLSAGVTQGNGVWKLTKGQLAGLTITPPANSDADFALLVKAISTDGSNTAVKSKTLNVTVNPVNDAPVLQQAIADRTLTEGDPFSLVVPAKTFKDIEDATLTYTATRTSGKALPTWLSFDSKTRSFSGTPFSNSVGTFSIRVVGTDSGNLSVSEDFIITVGSRVMPPNPTNLITGTSGSDSDRVRGTDGGDRIFGYGGNDYIRGFGGSDVLKGGGGDDILEGGDGSDLLDGGRGKDRLTGGNGRDIFVLKPGSGKDTILDFQDGRDFIGLGGDLSFDRLAMISTTFGCAIKDTLSGEVLAKLKGISASLLTVADFTAV